MTHPPRTHRQFLTNISHLTQTFPARCYFALRSICYRHKRGDVWHQSLVSPACQSKITHGPRLETDIDLSMRRSSGKSGYLFEEHWNTGIDLRATEPTGWLTSDTIKWKQEGTEDHHYINHQSFPRIPSSIICTHHLMGFVCSETNFSVNITVTSLPLTLAQSHGDRKTKDRGKTQEEMKINRTEVLAFVT